MKSLTPFEREDEDFDPGNIIKATIICVIEEKKIKRRVNLRKKEDYLITLKK